MGQPLSWNKTNCLFQTVRVTELRSLCTVS